MILWDKCCSPDSAPFTPGFIFVSLSARLDAPSARASAGLSLPAGILWMSCSHNVSVGGKKLQPLC